MSDNDQGALRPTRKVPKGVLIAIGGAEDKEQDLRLLRRVVSLIKKNNVKIELITTASEIPDEVGEIYIQAFSKIEGTSLGIMKITTRDEALDSALLKRIDETDIIYFTGGDQLRLTSILGGSPMLLKIREKYFNEFCIIAGTSAGASAMSETMIYGGTASEALLKGAVHMTGGIGLIGRVIIDSHFIKRGRFSRLMQIISSNPGKIGLGLGEDTGIIIERGRYIKAIGSGLVVIFDGQNLRYTNIADILDGEAIAIENIHVHTIVKGFGYDIKERKYLKPSDLECLDLICQ